MFELARGYAAEGMPAYVRLQEREFALEDVGYTATKHQREVGAGWFDEIAQAVSGGTSSTLALKGSTEEAQFQNGNALIGASVGSASRSHTRRPLKRPLRGRAWHSPRFRWRGDCRSGCSWWTTIRSSPTR